MLDEILRWFGETQNLTLLVGFLTLVVCCWTAIAIHKRQKQEEQEKQQEVRKARLVPRVTKEHKGAGGVKYKLEIENRGSATARAVKVFLDDKPRLKHTIANHNEEDIEEIAPHATIHYQLAVGHGGCQQIRVRLSWKDDSNESGKYETTLTL